MENFVPMDRPPARRFFLIISRGMSGDRLGKWHREYPANGSATGSEAAGENALATSPPVDRSAERPSVSGIPSDELYNYNLNIEIYLIIDLMSFLTNDCFMLLIVLIK